MIAFIKGTVFSYGIDWVIVDVNGVGYKIFFGHPEILTLNKDILIYTYQHVREDEISLYGFTSKEENDLFLKLINVKGIGPKIAMNVVSKANYKDIINSIENNDIAFLKSMPGIGAKAASQIILDLKGKLVNEQIDNKISSAINDALEGLKSLGYKQGELNSITNNLMEYQNLSSDEYLKIGLQLLMKKKMGWMNEWR